MRILLASRSPRRAELLKAAGFEFDVAAIAVEERRRDAEDAEAYVTRLARSKADAVVSEEGIIVAADTVVAIADRILEKPADTAEAIEMLQQLQGKQHEVLTAVTVRTAQARAEALERTKVWFLPMTAEEIEWYVTTGEPTDKAGAYAIQGVASRFVDRIDGSYSNVVGLPVATVYRLLRQIGFRDVPH